MPSSHPAAYEQLSFKITNFIKGAAAASDHSISETVTEFFRPDNIRLFLEKYIHFHLHFSFLHIPTFRAMDAYVGLVAGMCCVGACYSNFVARDRVRVVVSALRTSLEANTSMLTAVSARATASDLEELQAIMLTHIMLTWHGTPLQRDRARQNFPVLASLARRAGLLAVSRDASLYSPIHQPDFSAYNFSASNFNWSSWVEQEKRVRTMYMVFLCDASLGLYFNTRPEFDSLELRLPLPADDAAWDALSAVECAECLGLHGAQTAMIRNADGTRRCNQPEIRIVLKALLDNSYLIQPGVTNLHGKFILIHAIISMIRRVQLDGSDAMRGSGTPIPQNVWFLGARSNGGSPMGSGRTTPVDLGGNLLDPSTYKSLSTALDKFKANWDHDMLMQFPPSTDVHPRRYGFSKDGIHFFYLAKYLLSNTRAADLQIPPDHRFSQVMHLLKSVKSWVMSDGAKRGEELGSVGNIDRDFGVSQSSLDMTQLFKPMPGVAEASETVTVRTGLAAGLRGVV